MNTLLRHVADHAARCPEAPAILATGHKTVSYAQLRDRISETAARLRRLHITAQDRVAVVLPEGAENAVAILGVATAATCAPLNPAHSARTFAQQLTAAKATALLVEAGTPSPAVAAARSLDIPVITLEARPAMGLGSFTLTREGIATGHAAASNDAGNEALLLLTSGTSGQPKAVVLTHDNICFSAASIASALALGSMDRALGAMPLYHIHGLSILFATLVSGGSFVSLPGFATQAFFAALDDFRPSWYSASPTIHRAVLDGMRNWRGAPHDTGLRLIRSASAKAPLELIARVERAFGVPFIEAYGMTEAAPQIASNRLPPFVRKPGSVGKAAGPDIAIVSETGQPSPPGVIGEITIRGRNVAQGHGRTSPERSVDGGDGWFRTGDLGYLDSEGYLFVTGRLTDVINRGGEKLSPLPIEQILLEHPSVADATVFGVPHAILGEDVAAAIVLTPGAAPGNPIEHIRSFAAARLAPFEVPQRIAIVDTIPTGANGKADRRRLAQSLDAAALASRQRSALPATAMEHRLAELFAEVLNSEPPGIEEDFFDLGGQSLAAMQLIARLEESFGISLPIETMFESRTIAQLAARIGAHIADLVASGEAKLAPVAATGPRVGTDRIAPRPDGAATPLSFAQQRVYFLDRTGAGSAYNMSLSLRLAGPLDEQAMSLAVDEIRRRHDILRTTFHQRAGEVVQLVDQWHATSLPVIDLTATGADSRASEASELAATEADRPFDLAAGPLFRASLVRLAKEDHLLLLTMHHMICDGWSVAILHDELRSLYAALAMGRSSPLSEPAIQYGDFAAWQRGRANRADHKDEIERLARQFDDLAPECTFPADRPRPAVQSYRGAVHHSAIGRHLLDRLTSLAREQQATPFMAFLAAFKTLLCRYNGQDRAAVGVPIANRSQTQLESMIGFFANTLVLASDCGGDPCFTDMLGRVRATALDAFAHRDAPLEQIVERLNLPRDPGRPPLFQVMFAFQNMPGTESGPAHIPAEDAPEDYSFELAPGLSAQPLRVGRTTAKFDLTLYLAETPQGMSATWQYSTDLFTAETVAAIAGHFETLIGSIVADPSQRLSQLQLMTDEERRRIERAFNRIEAEATGDSDFVALLEAQAARCPDALAVCDDAGALSYAELNDRANRYARYFRSAGIAEQSLVGVSLPRSAELVAILIGVWKSGAAFLPLEPDAPPARTRFMLEDAAATHLIVQHAPPTPLDAMPLPVLRLDECAQAIAQQEPANLGIVSAPGALAYVIYTSGSTGKPKGVEIDRGNVAHYARALPAAIGLGPDDRYLHAASFAVSSSIRQFVAPLAAGGSLYIASDAALRDPRRLFATIRAQRITVLDFVPSYSASCLRVMRAMDAAARSELLDNDVRLMLSASEPLPSALVEGWRSLWRPDLAFINMYGQTETTGIVLTHEVPGDGEAAIVRTIGRPIANTQASILDASLALVPTGIRGELYIGGRSVGRGYRNRPEQTAQAFLANPFATGGDGRFYRTGDLARYRADGTIELLGRSDAQIKIRSFRVEPDEIEAAIRDQPEVRECIVCPLPDDAADGPIGLVAFIAADRAAQDPAEFCARLRNGLRQTLPDPMIPQRMVLLDRLPRTISGKIDRQALLAGLEDTPDVAERRATQAVPKTVPTDQAEAILTAVWRKVLRRDDIGVHDNFFDLGGNSLLTIDLVLEAEDAGLAFDLQQLYQNQTIAALARVLTGDTPRTAAPFATAPGEAEGRILFTAESLRAYGREALTRAGLSAEGAAIVTEVQLEASMRGQPTHDMVSIPRYATRISRGTINPRPNIRIEHETAGIARIDGDNGPGQWVATVAMDAAIAKARAGGFGVVTVRRSNHFGAAGHYVWQAAQRGLIGICTTNGPLILAPTGGVTAMFGNNPLAVGIPAGRSPPILLDIAMSVAPRGKIGLAVAEGRGLAPGWILDNAGRPSVELSDLAAGLGVPIGGHKGYGLALVLEVLAGVLSGAGFGSDHHRDRLHALAAGPDFGHLFMALDPAQFMPPAEFAERVDRLIAQTRTSKRAEGVDEILIPGEMELRNRTRSLSEGVRLRRSTYDALLSYANKAGLRTRIEVAVQGDGVSGRVYAE